MVYVNVTLFQNSNSSTWYLTLPPLFVSFLSFSPIFNSKISIFCRKKKIRMDSTVDDSRSSSIDYSSVENNKQAMQLFAGESQYFYYPVGHMNYRYSFEVMRDNNWIRTDRPNTLTTLEVADEELNDIDAFLDWTKFSPIKTLSLELSVQRWQDNKEIIQELFRIHCSHLKTLRLSYGQEYWGENWVEMLQTLTNFTSVTDADTSNARCYLPSTSPNQFSCVTYLSVNTTINSYPTHRQNDPTAVDVYKNFISKFPKLQILRWNVASDKAVYQCVGVPDVVLALISVNPPGFKTLDLGDCVLPRSVLRDLSGCSLKLHFIRFSVYEQEICLSTTSGFETSVSRVDIGCPKHKHQVEGQAVTLTRALRSAQGSSVVQLIRVVLRTLPSVAFNEEPPTV